MNVGLLAECWSDGIAIGHNMLALRSTDGDSVIGETWNSGVPDVEFGYDAIFGIRASEKPNKFMTVLPLPTKTPIDGTAYGERRLSPWGWSPNVVSVIFSRRGGGHY